MIDFKNLERGRELLDKFPYLNEEGLRELRDILEEVINRCNEKIFFISMGKVMFRQIDEE